MLKSTAHTLCGAAHLPPTVCHSFSPSSLKILDSHVTCSLKLSNEILSFANEPSGASVCASGSFSAGHVTYRVDVTMSLNPSSFASAFFGFALRFSTTSTSWSLGLSYRSLSVRTISSDAPTTSSNSLFTGTNCADSIGKTSGAGSSTIVEDDSAELTRLAADWIELMREFICSSLSVLSGAARSRSPYLGAVWPVAIDRSGTIADALSSVTSLRASLTWTRCSRCGPLLSSVSLLLASLTWNSLLVIFLRIMSCSTSFADIRGIWTLSLSIFADTGFLLSVPRRHTLESVSALAAGVMAGCTRVSGSQASISRRNESSPSWSRSERSIESSDIFEVSVSWMESSGLRNVRSRDTSGAAKLAWLDAWSPVFCSSFCSSSSSSASLSSLASSGLPILISLKWSLLTTYFFGSQTLWNDGWVLCTFWKSCCVDQIARMSSGSADSADETRFCGCAISGPSNDSYRSSINRAFLGPCSLSWVFIVSSAVWSTISTVASLSGSDPRSEELPSSAETKSFSLKEAVLCTDTWRALLCGVGLVF
ncbi:hypothetical protein OGATHE_006442 [Ogataea polymorpha]|uniref:Uncharacterized protein n=1 Tax=Ogataea polymorpha TaxID=460523 RepID=A0A9P8NNX7_9ASCO|nr:hypothetical protein OGATHE_006442 [Ogataea polymorpha]